MIPVWAESVYTLYNADVQLLCLLITTVLEMKKGALQDLTKM